MEDRISAIHYAGGPPRRGSLSQTDFEDAIQEFELHLASKASDEVFSCLMRTSNAFAGKVRHDFFVDYLIKLRRLLEQPAYFEKSDTGERIEMEFADDHPTPEQEAMKGEGWKALQTKFPKITDEKIFILNMSLAGWTHAEISIQFDITVAAVDKMISRVFMLLREAAVKGELSQAELADMILYDTPPLPHSANKYSVVNSQYGDDD